MKKKYLVSISLVVLVLLGVSTFLLSELRAANGNVSSLEAHNRQLEDKVTEQSADLKVFDGINTQDLLRVCNENAKTQYSEYIRANSISVTEGNVTTLSPKSPNTIRQAEESFRLSEKNCTDRFEN